MTLFSLYTCFDKLKSLNLSLYIPSESSSTTTLCQYFLVPFSLANYSTMFLSHKCETRKINVLDLWTLGPKPKLKNHFRAHQLSVWLRLIPELHRAGMEDVEPKHNLFRGYADLSLYDGIVRSDPLNRIGEEFPKRNITTEPTTTTDYAVATCVSYIQGNNVQNVQNASTDTLASLDAAG